jgi:predicted kinase
VIDKVKKDLRILANSAVPEVKARAAGINKKEVIAELTAQFDEYLKRAKATVIDCSDVNPEIIFQKYFELSYPFEERQDKRHEFPDAFSIEALRDFAKSEKREIPSHHWR